MLTYLIQHTEEQNIFVVQIYLYIVQKESPIYTSIDIISRLVMHVYNCISLFIKELLSIKY